MFPFLQKKTFAKFDMLIFVFKIFANGFMTINNTALHPHADVPLGKKKHLFLSTVL